MSLRVVSGLGSETCSRVVLKNGWKARVMANHSGSNVSRGIGGYVEDESDCDCDWEIDGDEGREEVGVGTSMT